MFSVFPFAESSWVMYMCCALFGIGCGLEVTNFGLVLVHYFGASSLSSTKGFTMFANGMVYVALGPLLGE
jgi:hypothetical protein